MKTESWTYRKEIKTLQAMTEIHCRDHHPRGDGGEPLCDSCRAFLAYASKRLEKCAFGEDKPTCAKCPIHCYGKVERERAKEIMKDSGPKMLLRHPILSFLHFFDSFRSPQRIDQWRKAREARRSSSSG